MRHEFRPLALILVPIVSLLAIIGVVVVALNLGGTGGVTGGGTEGGTGGDDERPLYTLRNGRVADDFAAVERQVDFEFVEPPDDLIPWPLEEVLEVMVGEKSGVAYYYSDGDEGLWVDQRPFPPSPLPDRDEGTVMTMDGTEVRRKVSTSGERLEFEWTGCNRDFSVRTESAHEDLASEVVAALVAQCG